MSSRRSKRIVTTTSRSEPPEPEVAKSLIDDASGDEFLELPGENGEAIGAKKTSGKKRKFSSKAKQPAQPAPKKIRGIHGKLKDLVEMPIDVLFEIFSQMDPLDLVHLARTSKDLRAMLMSRSSAPIWRSARSNFHPQIPDCPEDLTEPAYAELLFGKSCHYCQRNVTLHHAWRARKRICNKCLPVYCDGSRWYHHSRHNFHEINTPYISITQSKSGRGVQCLYFFLEIRKSWVIEYERLGTEDDREVWLETLTENQQKIGEHALLCTAWLTEYANTQKTQVADLFRVQQALVATNFKNLWGDEVSNTPSLVQKFQELPEIVKLCKKEFTERALTSTITSKINAFMEGIKQAPLDRIKLASLRICLPVYKEAYIKHKATISDACTKPYPTVLELILEPTVLNTLTSLDPSADKTLTLDDLAPVICAIFPDATKRLRQRINSQLNAVLRNTLPDFHDMVTEKSDVFYLAITVFTCRFPSGRCIRRCFWYEDIVTHSRCAANREYINIDKDEKGEEETLNEVLASLKAAVMDEDHSITRDTIVDVKAADIISKLVTLCGLDPSKTTKQMMDEVNPIFDCIRCNSQERGRTTMNWSAMASHYKTKHTHDAQESLNVVLLSDNEATTARTRIAEQHARAWAANDPCIVACGHCGDYQDGHNYHNRKDIVAHIKRLHGKARVKDKDFIPRPDCNMMESSIFYMWPPRPESDEDE